MNGDLPVGGCHIPFGYDWPSPHCYPATGWVRIAQPQTFLPPTPEPRLSDEDVERIAKRVAQLLGAKTCSCAEGDACSECPR